MADTVNSGLYRWFTRAQLDVEKAKYIAAVQQSTAVAGASGGGGKLAGGTLNGQTVNFAYPAGVTSLEEWGQILQDAYDQLDDNPTQATDRAVARFR
jgi:hypothetical protein